MTFRSFLLLLLVFALAACKTHTDEQPPLAGPAPSEAVRKTDPEVERWFRTAVAASGTRIMAGDRIAISVQGKDELAVSRDVPPNGEVPIYRTNKAVSALGKTPQDLEKEIAAIYSADFGNPYVTVRIEKEAPRAIYVFGAVREPKDYQVTANDRLTVLQALTLAGGVLPQSDLSGVTVQRVYPPTGVTVASPPLDLRSVMEGDQRDNLIVEPGDTIVVPDLQESRVQVFGHVEKQGSVVWTRGMTLSRAIAEAGGFKRFAKKDAIKLIRNGREQMLIDYDEILDGKKPDLELEPRDVIFVDERWI